MCRLTVQCPLFLYDVNVSKWFKKQLREQGYARLPHQEYSNCASRGRTLDEFPSQGCHDTSWNTRLPQCVGYVANNKRMSEPGRRRRQDNLELSKYVKVPFEGDMCGRLRRIVSGSSKQQLQ